jgi:hypothetical protein
MTVAARRSRQPKLLAAGAFEAEISSFRLQLAAGGKSPKTIGMYTEAVRWFAAAHLLRETGRTGWEQAAPGSRDHFSRLVVGRVSRR